MQLLKELSMLEQLRWERVRERRETLLRLLPRDAFQTTQGLSSSRILTLGLTVLEAFSSTQDTCWAVQATRATAAWVAS